LWLIEVWFSASTFLVKIATFAKPQTVGGKPNDEKNVDKKKDYDEINNENTFCTLFDDMRIRFM